jgi:hypothetical protein
MVIQNLPASVISKTNQIYTLAVWNYMDVKSQGYEKVLRPLINMLKQLESSEGLKVNIGGQMVAKHGIVVAFSADNLGANALFGFLESFSARKFCRFCEATKETVQCCFNEKDFVLRTKDSYNDVMSKLSDQKYNSGLTGIKGTCCLHELEYFHIKNWAPDILHDLLEGVRPLECSLLLLQLEKQKVISLSSCRCLTIHQAT